MSKLKNTQPFPPYISIALIIILGFIAYGNSLNGRFIWDDDKLIRDNVYIKDWSHINQIFTTDIGSGAGIKCGSYRPLQIATYLIDYSLWRLNVVGYHLTNTLLHILAALAIYWLINILSQGNFISLFTSLLFVAHPIHTEVTSYISGRADSLAVLFLLLCFIFYMKSLYSKTITSCLLAGLSYILALLSRENCLILPILLLLYHYTFKKRIKLKSFSLILIVSFIYILLRLTVLKSILLDLSNSSALLQRLPGFFVALANYVRLMLLPFNLHMEYGNKLFDLADPKVILGMVILLSLLIYTFRIRNTHKLVFFSLSWFIITLLPHSNLYPINAYMAEHWLYLPSIGFFLIIARSLSSLYRRRETRIFAMFLVISLLAFYSYLTIKQNNYWKKPIVFYEQTLKYAPDSTKTLNNLGIIYFDIGKKEEAVALFKKAIEIDPADSYAYINLGYAYQQLNKGKEAMILFKKAIEIDPDNVNAYNHLGNTYSNINMHQEAIASYKKAIEIDPNFILAYYNLGITYSNINMHQEAIASYKKAIEIDPNFTLVRDKLNNLYRQNPGLKRQ